MLDRKKELSVICTECAKVKECLIDMKHNTKMMYCSDYKKSKNLGDKTPQIEFNKMRIAIDMEEI